MNSPRCLCTPIICIPFTRVIWVSDLTPNVMLTSFYVLYEKLEISFNVSPKSSISLVKHDKTKTVGQWTCVPLSLLSICVSFLIVAQFFSWPFGEGIHKDQLCSPGKGLYFGVLLFCIPHSVLFLMYLEDWYQLRNTAPPPHQRLDPRACFIDPQGVVSSVSVADGGWLKQEGRSPSRTSPSCP